ncbi:MAG: hypothetical protein U1A78_07900 [Polyangia bacterium]
MSEPAPFILHRRLQRVALVRLVRTATTPAEVEVMATLLDSLYREAGGPLVLVAVPASGLSPPSEEVRAAIFKRIKERFASGKLERAYLIVPTGNLFLRAMLRSFFTGLRMVLGLQRQLHIADRIEEVAGEVARVGGIQAAELIETARELVGS